MEQKKDYLKVLWTLNLFLFLFYITSIVGVNYFKSSILEYKNIKSDKFDGTTYPILYVPDRYKLKDRNSTFTDLSIDSFIPVPKYDLTNLEDSSWKNKTAWLARNTYTVVYMWSYNMNYKEYDGSHLGIDVIAPAWTPIFSIANWVVVKVKNDASWNWKNVVVRHDDITVLWITQTVFSSYSHMSEIIATEWAKIKKWGIIWKVGKTWTATTNHLHFQIDKADAPFSPYWPFTTKEASNNWLGFFEAVNAWLGKENWIKYTINPLEFVQDNLTDQNLELDFFQDKIDKPKTETTSVKVAVNTEDLDKLITNVSATEETKKEEAKAEKQITDHLDNIDKLIEEIEKIDPKSKTIEQTNSASLSTTQNTNTGNNNSNNIWTLSPKSDKIFSDIEKNSNVYKASKYVLDKWIMKGFWDNSFKPENSITRKEALLTIFRTFNIDTNSQIKYDFSDISKTDTFKNYIDKAIELKILWQQKNFRPNDQVTRYEFIAMFIRAYKYSNKETINYAWKNRFTDLLKNSPFYNEVNIFWELLRLNAGYINWSEIMKRWEVSKIIYSFYKFNW